MRSGWEYIQISIRLLVCKHRLRRAAEEISPLGTGEVAREAYAETLDRAANTAAHLRGRDLDHVLVESPTVKLGGW